MITGLILLTIPYVIWLSSSPKWHPFLAILYTVIAVTIILRWVRQSFREAAEINANPAATADWKWPDHLQPEKFRTQIGIFLMRQGWRIQESKSDAAGWVTLLLSKDRWCVALLCTGPNTALTPAALAALETIQKGARVTHTALAMAQPQAFPAASGLKRSLARLTLRDFASFDEALGITNVQV